VEIPAGATDLRDDARRPRETDVIEADDAAAAEEEAVEAWTRVEPRSMFRPLLTLQVEPNGAKELALDAELQAEAATTQDERERWLRIAAQWWGVA
jgi:hypothetical protein